jgi:hypothetical protein
MMNGKSLVSSGLSGTLHPYIKIFFLRLCPWKSQNIYKSLSFANYAHNYFVANIVGCNTLLGFFQRLFKSQPANEHR